MYSMTDTLQNVSSFFPKWILQKKGRKEHLQCQSDRKTDPQAVKVPAQAERKAKGDGEGNHVVGDEISWPTNGLLANAAEETVSSCAETIKKLHDGHKGEDAGDNLDDFWVVGEEDGEVETEGREYGDVEGAKNARQYKGLYTLC